MSVKITDVRVLKGDSAFLLDDGKTAVLYDTGFGFTGEGIAEKIKSELKGRTLDYIFLTHSHYDHALAAAYILNSFPNAKVVAGEYAQKIFAKDSAKAVMRELDRKFAEKNGVFAYADLSGNLRVDIAVKDGDIISAGSLKFTAINLPGHTRCSVGYYLEEEGLLLSSETLGVYVGEDVVVPSFLVGYEMTLNSIEKVENLSPKKILVPHFGVLEEAESREYLKNAKASAMETAREIAKILREGRGKEAAIEYFIGKFYFGKIKEAYPYDAMMLNTKIMVELIEKELL